MSTQIQQQPVRLNSASNPAYTQAVTQRLSLLKNFSWTALGNIVSAITKWITLILFVRLGSEELLGQYALGLAITAPIMVFASLRLRSVQATDLSSEYEFSDYFCLRCITMALGMICIGMVCYFTNYATSTKLVIIAVGLMKVAEGISDIYYGLIQRHQCMDRIGKALIFKSILSFLALAACLYFTHDTVLSVLMMTACFVFVLFFYEIPSAQDFLPNSLKNKSLAKKFRFKNLKHTFSSTPQTSVLTNLIVMSLPMGFVLFIESISINTPRYYLEDQAGVETLGFFSAVAYIPIASAFVITALGHAVQPRFAELINSQQLSKLKSLIFKLSLGVVFSGGLLTVACFFFGDFFLSLIYGNEYEQYATLLSVMMLCATLGCLFHFLDCFMIANRGFRCLLVIQILSYLSLAGTLEFFSDKTPITVAMISLVIRECVRLGLALLVCFGYFLKAEKQTE